MTATGQRESRPLKGIRYGAASAVAIELAPLAWLVGLMAFAPLGLVTGPRILAVDRPRAAE